MGLVTTRGGLGSSNALVETRKRRETGRHEQPTDKPSARSVVASPFSREILAPPMKSVDVQSVQGLFSWWLFAGTIGRSGQITEQITPAAKTIMSGSSISRSDQIMTTEYTHRANNRGVFVPYSHPRRGGNSIATNPSHQPARSPSDIPKRRNPPRRYTCEER